MADEIRALSSPVFLPEGGEASVDLVVKRKKKKRCSLTGCIVICGGGCNETEGIRILFTDNKKQRERYTDRQGFFRFGHVASGLGMLTIPDSCIEKPVMITRGENFCRIDISHKRRCR